MLREERPLRRLELRGDGASGLLGAGLAGSGDLRAVGGRLLRFLRVQRGEPHSKLALLIYYFLLATLLLSRPFPHSPV